MTTKSAELAHDEHANGKMMGAGNETGAGQYLQPNGQSGTDLSRQISVQLTPQQFEGEWREDRVFAVPRGSNRLKVVEQGVCCACTMV